MKVLAIDPGYDRLGLAVLEQGSGDAAPRVVYSTCVQTDKKSAASERLFVVGEAVRKALEEHAPHAVALETLFFNANRNTAMHVAEARGIVCYLAQAHSVPLFEYSPQQIKVATTGHGGSDKKAVIAMVQRLVPTAPKKALDDEYDAIAVGITCLACEGRSFANV